jgi:integrase
MSTAKKGFGEIWDAKGQDVPGGRVRRSVQTGYSGLTERERTAATKKRRTALDLLRRYAAATEDEQDRTALWALVPVIGRSGYPTWDEMIAARSPSDFLALAHRGELHIETDARLARDAAVSERRTCGHGVDEYLRWREGKRFSADGDATVTSALRRALRVTDRDGSQIANRRIAGIGNADAELIMDTLSVSTRPGFEGRVKKSTEDKNRRSLSAWFTWEIQREQDRAQDQRRTPLFTRNPFVENESRYSKPSKDHRETIQQKEDSRRFFPDEIERLIAAADTQMRHAIIVTHRLGLRAGELIHLRWLNDVIPLERGHGYEILIQGNRGRDRRCGCLQCLTKQGWAPKNGPRRYFLDRRFDDIGWITPACDALDRWVDLHRPQRGEILFPRYSSRNRAWWNQDLNKRLREFGEDTGVTVGRDMPGNRTFHSLRHACASEMLELGVSHPHAAWWIGDTLDEFMKTYGRPSAELMSRITLSKNNRESPQR